jgi:aspartyl-tRNA synthetase
LELDLLRNRQRTHHCGELRPADAGKRVFLAGWVARRRDLGNLIFIDLRDHTGITQVVCRPEMSADAHAKAEQVRSEYVLGIEGEVALRAPETVKKDLATGAVEVVVRELLVLNEARTPPFPIEDEGRMNEEPRLRYRYLDLRRSRMQHHLRLRHHASLVAREHMTAHGFVDIETPFLTRSTPEGARDYLVPSRVHPGHFYALPQSPQLFKQILMIAGFDRYFQIVRCFRDEDLRADRQPEFTQIDIEMAFPVREVLFDIIEGLIGKLFELIEVKVERPFAILPYDEAMEKYGSDKPHLGFDLAWKRIELPQAARGKIHVAEPLKILRVPGWASASRSQLDKLHEIAKSAGADWSSYVKVGEIEVQSPLIKVAGDTEVRELVTITGAAPGDLVLLLGVKQEPGAAGHGLSVEALRHLDEASGEVRLEIARRLDLIKPGAWSFAWVVDFPMFEYDEKENRYGAMHHPFTSPREEDMDHLESNPSGCKARAYDLVLNGSEIGGGSIRIHRPDIQRRVFTTLGITPEKAKERFGFFLDALESGAPPHGGIALGWDRIIALMAGETNIREVIAFPKTASAMDLMCDAPSPVDPEQLKELELEIKPAENLEAVRSRVKDAEPPKSEPPRWSHKEVFPIIAEVIREKCGRTSRLASHDEIATALVHHPSMQDVFEHLERLPNSHMREWEASNMVVLFSNRITEGTALEYAEEFDRKEQAGGWAYKPRSTPA